MKSLLEGGHAIRDKLQASTKYSRRLPGLRRLHRKQKREQKLVIFFFFLFLCKWKYPKHPQHVQPGEVRWTAAWNWALIHPFCSLLMNTDNGKSVDAKTPQFLWIYRLIFCTSSRRFYACAEWWHSWCKVLPNYHRDIFTLHFHWYGKWLQVSKAKENVCILAEKRNIQRNKKLNEFAVSGPDMDMHGYVLFNLQQTIFTSPPLPQIFHI